ncbi:PTS sugar transporter subunit IIA [Neobacillus muris]|uniref:PTS sugar transporter subunit IIA n=1 Tax=Neobacillus muris TaxID=2941334 RepID=UPI00203DF195|nr:PTS sugar transporter subunit IIA [Neobacillus muris]
MNQLMNLIKPESIFFLNDAKSNAEILSFAADRLFEKNIVKDTFKDALLQREKEFPTGLPTQGAGVAIPHTESPFVIENQVAILILSQPVPFQMMGVPDHQVDVSIVFLLALTKAESHLEILKELMHIIQTPTLLRAILQSKKVEEVLDSIQSFVLSEGNQ